MFSLIVQTAVAGMATGLLYGLIGLGVVIFWQTTNLINFAHISSAMLGAYFFYTLLVMFKLPILAAFPLAVAGVMCYGVLLKTLVYKPLSVREGGRMEFVIATLMLCVLLLNGVVVVWGGVPLPFPPVFGDPGSPLDFGGIIVQQHSLWVLGIVGVLVALLQFFFQRTLAGKSLRATAQNKQAAALMGINVDTMQTLSFILSTGVTAVAGILLAPVYFVSLELGGGIIGIKGFASAVLAGLVNPLGALLGGVTIGIAETFIVFFVSSTYRDAITFLLLILVLMFRPGGVYVRRQA